MSRDFISVDVTMTGLSDLESYIETYVHAVNDTPKKASMKLATIGSKVANTRFRNAKYAGDNDASAGVDFDKDTGLASVVAYGKAAPFIEFGTGILHGYESLQGARTSEVAQAYDPLPIGTYGKGLGMDDYWVYEGPPGNDGTPIGDNRSLTEGHAPQGPMYWGMLVMKSQLRQTCKRVFDGYF